jgi:hypothetical protein
MKPTISIREDNKMETNKYRTQKQFDEIVDSVINGNFDQAVNLVLDYGFYAKDLRKLISHTHVECALWENEDLYQVIETATRARSYHNVKEASKRLAQSALDD